MKGVNGDSHANHLIPPNHGKKKSILSSFNMESVRLTSIL